jgi:uncharacterized protein YbjT (DUF2867 family)
MAEEASGRYASELREKGDWVMLKTDKIMLITGATGQQGGAVIRHMLAKGWSLRALTRNSSSDAALNLARQGVELAQGDLEDLPSLEQAAHSVYGIYSVQNFWKVGAKREVQQGKSLADVAKKAGVEHFVYSSVGGAERNSGIGHWATKWEIEQYIRKLGLPATMIRPTAFMENYYSEQTEIGILQGKFVDAIRVDKPYQTIAVDDIGAFVALAFDRPKEFIGQAIEIAGSELTNPQAAEVFSRVLGKRVEFEELPMTVVRSWREEYYQMYRWFNEEGFNANIAELRRRYPEVHLHTLEEWLYSEGWQKHARRILPPTG